MISILLNDGQEYKASCYKLLMRTDGRILYCKEHPFEKNDRLPPRYLVKVGKRDLAVLLYIFGSSAEAAQEYAKTERLLNAKIGRWPVYIQSLKKKYLVECPEL
jgi:hypothetical protein